MSKQHQRGQGVVKPGSFRAKVDGKAIDTPRHGNNPSKEHVSGSRNNNGRNDRPSAKH